MMENHSADLGLLIQVQVGNEDKFMALFNCYSSMVRRLWQRYHIPDLEFEDWCQEAQLVLLKVIYSYSGKDIHQFSGFYKQSLVNRLLDLYRARQANKRIPIEQLGTFGENDDEMMIRKSASLEDIVYCHKSIEEIIRISSPFERDVLSMIVTGRSIEQVCRELQCSKRQVQSALSRTRTKLVKLLAGE
ncbi:sigma-70 family RNA polymerase sigma factor [Limosilactobacillus fastidiosus]|uniref:Sigma-70 family RNA polymerase sigma factor n=1 Tax=Limosilactobacillus fastidiosus TaxID=2759855 RepID=A0A7W3TZZ8_9LACO|nr:sigma-70 family RNA polymerase sigma factor [Limosilactobacillus fastidiosus]MBB1062907.1 sigma-70 family RNA polymerase sigma factor [Limosilactobacillus fastidiosus]MBB1086424.1 sigma-70 family RNA polymerase sigma factor [Limosilactobacillus fastidiosus]MCD7083753.1 sigma-70 family RNA polymerase sigma factor [Limosilactobacillus fastidiosus]MCD7086303.1 sigma-70 family RNA polymerase sigma factor [Limosilactobacillus fastidiosus]MCD7114916.1 sigma-70 family RNA polymerase sigma factor [